MPLTEIAAKNAKPREQAFKLSDGGGLFLLVQPNGSKLWRMKYRFGGKEKLLSFGAYPAVGVAAARDKRNAAKAQLSEGFDPTKDKVKAMRSGSDTFRVVAERWHENRKSALNAAHADRVWSRLERDVFPFLGDRPIQEITPPDVLEMVRKIEARGALDISRRAKQGVGQVFQFAIACGLAESDPTTHLRGALKPRPRVQHTQISRRLGRDAAGAFRRQRSPRRLQCSRVSRTASSNDGGLV
ncbi:MAG: integrase arm-type DNA-binding domain-containing protein [Sphingomonadaceae bacterium]